MKVKLNTKNKAHMSLDCKTQKITVAQIQYKFVRDTIRNVQNVDSMNSPIVGDGCWEGELVCILCNKRREQTWSCMISMQMESTYIAKKLLDTINSFKRETFIQTAE